MEPRLELPVQTGCFDCVHPHIAAARSAALGPSGTIRFSTVGRLPSETISTVAVKDERTTEMAAPANRRNVALKEA